MTAEIERWGAGRSVAEVVATLVAAGVPAAPVRTPGEAVVDGRVAERGETAPVVHPQLGEIPGLRTAGLPLRFTQSAPPVLAPAPRLGEHTEQVLARIAGYSVERIAALRADGVV